MSPGKIDGTLKKFRSEKKEKGGANGKA